MKPFVVEYTFRAVVMADDDVDAFAVAEDVFREVCSDARPDVEVLNEVLEPRHLPSGWDMGCLPYGGDGRTRLQALIGAQGHDKGGEDAA